LLLAIGGVGSSPVDNGVPRSMRKLSGWWNLPNYETKFLFKYFSNYSSLTCLLIASKRREERREERMHFPTAIFELSWGMDWCRQNEGSTLVKIMRRSKIWTIIFCHNKLPTTSPTKNL
jgi:hypothetical protein